MNAVLKLIILITEIGIDEGVHNVYNRSRHVALPVKNRVKY